MSVPQRAEEVTAWLDAIVRSSDDAIIGMNRDGVVASWNPAAERLFGYVAAEVVGKHASALIAQERRADVEHARRRALSGQSVGQIEAEGLRKDASTFPVTITLSTIRDAEDRIIGVVQIDRDASERMRLEHELRTFADHDPLTGLYNRRRFIEELTRHVAYTQRYGRVTGAVLMGDLDNFKRVNDALGHKAGDELLKAVSRALTARLRETDLVARLGGDEFAVLLPQADLAGALGVAEALRAAVGEVELVLEGHRLRATMSVGVAEMSAELSAADELAAADMAMYEAKRLGRDRVASTLPAGHDQRRTRGTRALGWAERLRGALEEDRFELHAQPIVGLCAAGAGRHELLLRMREDGELVPPAAFVYTAERVGLIEEIDRWVIERAVRLLADAAHGDSALHVNLSGISILKPDILDFLSARLAASAVDPARLTLEITETAAIIDLDRAQRFARDARALGCTLALDDFGSGFGSFTYLKYVPVNYLKIDGSFITAMNHSRTDQLLVKAIIDLAHGMDIEAIAEHVDGDETRRRLLGQGADYGQGYGLGEPQMVELPM